MDAYTETKIWVIENPKDFRNPKDFVVRVPKGNAGQIWVWNEETRSEENFQKPSPKSDPTFLATRPIPDWDKIQIFKKFFSLNIFKYFKVTRALYTLMKAKTKLNSENLRMELFERSIALTTHHDAITSKFLN